MTHLKQSLKLNPTNPAEAAEAAVLAILEDLTGRRGLRQAWEDIDLDIQQEIAQTWADTIRSKTGVP